MSTLILAAQGQGAGGGMGMIIILIAMFVIMWLFMIRPQQKKQKEIRNFQNSLQAGDHVVTGGGIYGTVKNINLEKNTVEVEIARGVNIVVDKSYVFADANSPMRQA